MGSDSTLEPRDCCKSKSDGKEDSGVLAAFGCLSSPSFGGEQP